MVKILVKLKSRNLPKSKSENLSRSKKAQSTSDIRESNFLTFNTKKVFTKLR